VVPITTTIEGSKVSLEYHIFHYLGLNFILIGVPLHALLKGTDVDISYAAPQAHIIVNVALHREYSLGIVFIFSQGRKDLYHV
jgi:hypothetical protein